MNEVEIETNTDTDTDTDARVWHVPGELVRAGGAGAGPSDFSVLGSDALLKLATKSAFDPTIFDERTPYFALCRISNSRLDSYFTRMHDSTLKNFAIDAKEGVTVLASHARMSLGIGRSITGEMVKGEAVSDNNPHRVYSYFYTIPGLRLAQVSTDDVIDGMRSGIIHDISVGFRGGTHECSICKRDLWDWDCMHIPGMEYTDEKTKQTELATAWIKNSRLSEYSTVFDGATPGAEVISVKAVQESDAGRLTPETARLIESQFRINLPTRVTRRSFGGGANNTIEKETPKTVGETNNDSGTNSPVAELTAEQKRHLNFAARVEPLVKTSGILKEDEEVHDGLKRVFDELPTLRKLADEGRAYRNDLVESALTEGVRAYGNDFAKDTYKSVLERSDLEAVKRMRDDWKLIGDRELTGGRKTVDTEEVKPAAAKPSRIPASSHRV